MKLVYENGLEIESISINRPSLEEVFLSIVNNDDLRNEQSNDGERTTKC
ncbi:MAG: hypothetical protein ACJ71P_01840 [Nitrososphaeraceae archaeon]